jgi:hypothetical protein
MSHTEELGFDELVDLLRVRIGLADDLNAEEIHSFKVLMDDLPHVTADHFYWQAFEELRALGHLDPVSHKEFEVDACGRLSADGRLALRSSPDSV